MTIHFPTSVNVCFCTTWGKQNQQNITFYPMRYDYLINITHKNTFWSHFWLFGWHFIHFSTAHSKIDWNANPLCEHKHGDVFSIHWQQYR